MINGKGHDLITGWQGMLALVLLVVVLPTTALAERYAALVVDVNSGQVLFERHADQLRHPASLTKMMTLYLVFEALESGKLSLGQRLAVSDRAAKQPPSKLGLKVGESITVQDAILALVTKSANDVATVVAEGIAGSEWRFSRLMTERARQLGMSRTEFRNASGLYDAKQLTTAHDMYRLGLALQRNYPKQYRYFSTGHYQFRKASYRNHNGLLRTYTGTDGIKTGYIRAAGFNLVASVRRANHHLIGVVFGGRSARTRNQHMEEILDNAFVKLASQPPVQLASHNRASVLNFASLSGPNLTQPVTSGSGEWMLQVGAFLNQSTAERHLGHSQRLAAQNLGQAALQVTALQRGNQQLFRARFAGLSEDQAKQACWQLRQQRVDCVIVAPGS